MTQVRNRARPCDRLITSQGVQSQLHFRTTSVPLKCASLLQGDRQNAGSQGPCLKPHCLNTPSEITAAIALVIQEAPPDSGV